MCSSESNSSFVLMDKLSEEDFRACWEQEGAWGKDHEQVRERSEKSQVMIAPPVGVSQVLWEWPGRCNQKCCSTLVCVAWTFSSQSQIEANWKPASADKDHRIHRVWRTRSLTLWQHFQLFVSTLLHTPGWQWSHSHTGWALIPFLQRVGGSPLAEGKPSSAQPRIPGAFLRSRPLRFSDLWWKNKQIQKWEGRWGKGVGPLWN